MKLKKKLGPFAVVASLMALLLILGLGSGSGNATEAEYPTECYCTQPALSLAKENVYWADMGDYTAGVLSVDYDVTNSSDNFANAKNLQIVGTSNTSGVISIDHGRNVNMVSVDECQMVTVKYQVPPGVSTFSTNVYATTNDQCGNSYDYPGPMP